MFRTSSRGTLTAAAFAAVAVALLSLPAVELANAQESAEIYDGGDPIDAVATEEVPVPLDDEDQPHVESEPVEDVYGSAAQQNQQEYGSYAEEQPNAQQQQYEQEQSDQDYQQPPPVYEPPPQHNPEQVYQDEQPQTYSSQQQQTYVNEPPQTEQSPPPGAPRQPPPPSPPSPRPPPPNQHQQPAKQKQQKQAKQPQRQTANQAAGAARQHQQGAAPQQQRQQQQPKQQQQRQPQQQQQPRQPQQQQRQPQQQQQQQQRQQHQQQQRQPQQQQQRQQHQQHQQQRQPQQQQQQRQPQQPGQKQQSSKQQRQAQQQQQQQQQQPVRQASTQDRQPPVRQEQLQPQPPRESHQQGRREGPAIDGAAAARAAARAATLLGETGEFPIEMAPEYQPQRIEEGAIVDNDEPATTLMEEWEKHMQNFIPDMLVTFSLSARSDEYFYETVEGPVFLRGGFFVGGEDDQSAVDFAITDPDGDIVYKKSKSEGLFYFTAKKKGTYSFILSNHRWMESKTVTFAIGRGVETALLPKHLTTAQEMAEQLERQLKDIQAESSYLWIRQRSLNEAAQSFLRRLSWLSGAEFLMLIATAAFHAKYIVGLVSDRRIL